jgi:hypothetical protein
VVETESPGREAGARLVTVGQAAYLTDTARDIVDRAIKRGRIPFKRVDGVRMIALSDWVAFKAASEAKQNEVDR